MGKLAELAERVEDADKKLLQDKREDIKRRRKIFKAIVRFEAMVKKSLGRKITVKTRVADYDEVWVTTYFRPTKNRGKVVEHPMAGDAAVKSAFVDSGLDKHMELSGTGTYLAGKNAGVRDHDFIELKPQLTKG